MGPMRTVQYGILRALGKQLRQQATQSKSRGSNGFSHLRRPLTIKSNDDDWLQNCRLQVLKEALKHVPTQGWTDDALLAGAKDANLPPTLIASIDYGNQNAAQVLVSHHMETCYNELEQYLSSNKESYETPAELIFNAIKFRLLLNIPLMSKNQRWAEAMAIGAQPPYNTLETAAQVDKIINLIGNAAIPAKGWNFVERSMVASVYVMTELHLLQACSDGNDEHLQESWDFLRDRIAQLEMLAQGQIPTSTDAIVATSAVLTSLGGAVLSVLAPTASNFANNMFNNATNTIQSSLETKPFDPAAQNFASRSLHNNSHITFNESQDSKIFENPVSSKGNSVVHGIDLNKLPPFPENHEKTSK